MTRDDQRTAQRPDRRLVPRGGRRETDVPGRYPPVLIADRDPRARAACVGYLNWFGFEVTEAASGDEAAAVMGSVRFHAVVADANLASGLPPAIRTDVPLIVRPFTLPILLEELRRVLRERAGH
jgi:hypothetical protein